MRVAIREQLAALVVFAVLLALAVVSIPTWIYVNKFVGDVESSGLALTASLKAARISSEIELIQTTCQGIATRILIQQAFVNFYNGDNSTANWDTASRDLETALSTVAISSLLQARLYSRNATGNQGGILNITGRDMPDITLPYADPNGNPILFGNSEFGFPPMLYPNITYNDTGVVNPFNNSTNQTMAIAFPNVRLATNGGLVLGPLMVNATFALMSLTVPVRQINNSGFILGYMTLVASATNLIQILQSREGLGETGVVLVMGPDTPWNRFEASHPPTNDSYTVPNPDAYGDLNVHFIFPPHNFSSSGDRHSLHDFGNGMYYQPFPLESYPTVKDVFTNPSDAVNDASSALSTTNEQGYAVAVGVARPATLLVNWAVVIEQDRSEAYAPIVTLRNILLGCVFGTAGLVLLLIFPCAHLSVKPIRQLKTATEKSIAPPGYSEGLMDDELPSSGTRSSRSRFSEKGWFAKLQRMVGLHKTAAGGTHDHDPDRQIFKIPGRVPERKHFITDELTELTATFNAMSDELLQQYESLDEKVAERTRELEISKKAAEAANKSKTLFIANISHELKTPLNGIMGMCAVCMEEDDVVRIKQSLKTLYKSGTSHQFRRLAAYTDTFPGDLLLHLLEDLLSFSKNQIGHQVNLEEREFRLGDIRSQTLSIFDKQVRESRITFSVEFLNTEALNDLNISSSPERPSIDRMLPALGPAGAGRLKDMCLWGDQHRILQVIINLVSNSLKFTPAGGRVQLRIRCLGEAEPVADDQSRTSSFSKAGSNRAGRPRHRLGSSSTQSASSKGGTSNSTQFRGGTALSINPLDPKATPHIHIRERSPTPPPANAKPYIFEFQVEDTGPGISPHMQDKVFEPFVQGDLGLSKKFGGTGLGLSICQQLANLMGGTIGLTSTVGVGTTFSMRIPLRYVKDRYTPPAQTPPPRGLVVYFD